MSRSDHNGQATALTVLTPIVPGREGDLRAVLEALPTGSASPLARVPRTHVARFAIIDRLVEDDVPRQDRLRFQYLLFSSSLDGDVESYLTDICTHMPDEADAIWSHCSGYPGSAEAARFRRFVLDHRITSSFFFSAYPEATVHDVRTARVLREQLLAFVLGARGLDAAGRLESFRTAFP